MHETEKNLTHLQSILLFKDSSEAARLRLVRSKDFKVALGAAPIGRSGPGYSIVFTTRNLHEHALLPKTRDYSAVRRT